jgi:hypothetical protein
MAAADESTRAAHEATAPYHGRCYKHRAARKQAFECTVYHCHIRQFDESPGDHLEGHFEGQNGASER